jgi:2-polyprenyl-3-methyl-5-hydroxy-6-metoxy-1,4-benzoquinol methylase
MPTELHEERLATISAEVRASGARTLLDLGCGTGELLMRLVGDPQFTRIIGLEIDASAREEARHALGIGFPVPGARVEVRSGSYEDPQPGLVGFDAAVLLETIEHVAPDRLSRVERALFGQMRPRHVWVTTPNEEYNILHGMRPGERRHPGHRFEWNRAKFRQWAEGVAARNGYAVAMGGIGPPDPLRGTSTQVARFQRNS